MKKFIVPIIAAVLSIGAVSQVSAEFHDYEFNQDKMKIVDDFYVYLVSSFEKEDVIAAYTYDGVSLWEKTFYAKIVSWQVMGSNIIVFSKDRKSPKTYLTCIDRYTGKMLWQRP